MAALTTKPGPGSMPATTGRTADVEPTANRGEPTANRGVPRRTDVEPRRTDVEPQRVAGIVLRFVSAGLVAWVAAVHLQLWLEGYRFLPTNGDLFLADAIGGFLLAAVLLVRARPVWGLLSAGYLLGTLGALVISINVGLFGFRESSHAAFVMQSIVVESLGAIAVGIWTLVMLARTAGSGRGRRARLRP